MLPLTDHPLIWKIEGPTDGMALTTIIPPDLANTHLVTCNSGGAVQNVPPDLAELFRGRLTLIVHDADRSGEIGAAKWLQALAPVTEVRHIRLPYEIAESHGKDLRDWINEGGTYEQLLGMTEAVPAVPAAPAPATPALTPTAIEGNGQPASGVMPTTETHPPAATPPPSGNGDPFSPLDETILSSLELDVFGEYASGSVVAYASHHTRRKISTVKDPDKISFPRLLQLAGPLVRKLVAEPGEDTTQKTSLASVRNAICNVAGRRRLHDQALSGAGCWGLTDDRGRDLPGIVLVGSQEAAAWHADTHQLEQLNHARCGARLLDFSISQPWYDFAELAANIERAADPGWADATVNEATEIWGRWSWANPYAPWLVTGLILATWVQTIWSWRPQVAITGRTNTGKSILCVALDNLFCHLATRSSKSSTAGIRQDIETTARVMLVDEFEKSTHRQEILEMVRAASRGDTILRGTQEQRSKKFIVRHIFWLAAVEMGLKRAPDRNRYILLELRPPPPAKVNLLVEPEPAELADLGGRLLALAVRHAVTARRLAIALKRTRFVQCDPRSIESYSVPVAALASCLGWSAEKAGETLQEFLGPVALSEEHASDEDDLMNAILRAIVRIDQKEEATIAQCLSQGSAFLEAAERAGVTFYLDSAGAGWFFLDHRAVVQKLLKDTDWRNQTIDQMLLRVEGAVRGRARVAGRRPYGVKIPWEVVEREYLEGGGGEKFT